MRRFLAVFAVVANLALVDAVVKELAAGYLKGSAAVSVITDVFNLAYVENRGCAWGMLQGRVWALAAFAVIVMAVLVWRRKSIFGNSRIGFAAECLLYAGIVGNLIDRVFRGYVIDMFDFHFRSSHFPCFNLADSYITIAVVLLLFIPDFWYNKRA